MATAPKTNKPVSSRPSATTKSKGVVASKNRSLSKKQWTLIGIVGALVLGIGGYFGFQYYQDNISNAAGWTTVGTNHIGIKKKSYGTVKIYACKKSKGSGAYTVTSKQVTTGLYGDRNAPNTGAIFYIYNSNGKDLTGTGNTDKALGSIGTTRSITTKTTLKSTDYIIIYSATKGIQFDVEYYPSYGWQEKVSSLTNC